MGPNAITFDMEEVHELSVDYLSMLEEDGVKMGLGAVAAALSLGRLVCPRMLEPQEEMAFIQAIMEFAGMYFAEGGKVN